MTANAETLRLPPPLLMSVSVATHRRRRTELMEVSDLMQEAMTLPPFVTPLTESGDASTATVATIISVEPQ